MATVSYLVFDGEIVGENRNGADPACIFDPAPAMPAAGEGPPPNADESRESLITFPSKGNCLMEKS